PWSSRRGRRLDCEQRPRLGTGAHRGARLRRGRPLKRRRKTRFGISTPLSGGGYPKRRLDRLGRHQAEALGRDRLERVAQRGDPLLTVTLAPLCLDVRDQPAAGALRLAAARGEADDLDAAVARVGHALDVAELLQVADGLAHRLL